MARRPVPADLEDALAANRAARERFWSLPPEHLDRWVAYVERARFPGQRRRRIAETVRRLGGAPVVAGQSEVREGGVAVLPRDDAWTWLIGLALLAGLAAFLVWLTVYRHHDHHSAAPAAVVVTAKTTVPRVVGIKVQAAEFQLRQAKLGVKTVEQSSAKKKDLVVGQAPGAEKRVVQGTVVTLVVSKGPAGIAVPKLVGLSAADAVKQLQAKGLSVSLKQQAAQASPGTVVQQSPQPGQRAKKGTPVTLVVAKGAAAVVVPDETGQSQQNATNDLQAKGLNVHVVDVASSQPSGTVVAQSPAANAKVQQGSTVRLNVAARAPKQTTTTATTTTSTTAPTTTVQQSATGNDYRGMRLQTAVQKIAAGRQQVVVQYVTSTQPAGVVVANSNAGDKVKLQVSAGAQPKPSTSVTDETGQDAQTAQSDLTSAGFSVITVQWPVSDPSSDGMVVYETPSGSAPKGSAIVLYVGQSS